MYISSVFLLCILTILLFVIIYAWKLQFFIFLNSGHPTPWFFKLNILTPCRLLKITVRYCAKINQLAKTTLCVSYKIFLFSSWRHCIFKIMTFYCPTAHGGPRYITVPNITIFQFFKMAVVTILDFKSLNFLWPERSEGSKCINTPNFTEITQIVFEISWFFQFSRWLPSTI